MMMPFICSCSYWKAESDTRERESQGELLLKCCLLVITTASLSLVFLTPLHCVSGSSGSRILLSTMGG
jgi:hypothetical protein